VSPRGKSQQRDISLMNIRRKKQKLYLIVHIFKNREPICTVFGILQRRFSRTRLLRPPCVADADIIFLPCGFFFYLLSFFPRRISAVAEWMSTILLYTWRGLSANLGCRSEMCCALLARNTRRKNDAKNRRLGTIAQHC